VPLGAEVELLGLMKCPAFNGFRGSVQSFDRETGRYDILLDEPGQRVAKIRPENLRVLQVSPSALGVAPPMGPVFTESPTAR